MLVTIPATWLDNVSSRYCREKIIDVRLDGGWAMVYKAEAGQQQLALRSLNVSPLLGRSHGQRYLQLMMAVGLAAPRSRGVDERRRQK